jgi:PAS domain S-box-containing protein
MKNSDLQDSRGENNDTRDPQGLVHLLEIQRDLAISLLPCGNLTECLDLLLESAMRLPGFDCGGIYLYEEATGGVRLISHRGLSADFVEKASNYPADSPQARLVRAGELVYSMRSDLPPEISGAIAVEQLEALAVLPLHDRGKVIASLNVSSHHYPCIEVPSRLALESLVAQAEGAIVSIRAREARQIAERRLRLAVEGANLGTWMADFGSGAYEASDLAREMHGVASDAPLSIESAMTTIHPDDRQLVADALQRTITHGEPYSCVYRTVAAPGDVRWLASDARLSNEVGGGLLYGIVRDITRSKHAEMALIEARDQLEARVAERTSELEAANAAMREESKRLEMALDASQAGVSSWEIGSEMLNWDNRVRALYGFEPDVPVSLEDIKSRMHPDDRDALLDAVATIDLPGSGDSWNHEFRINHPVLGERWVARLGRVERDAEGLARLALGISVDITSRKHIEQALRQSEEKYRSLHQSMVDGFVCVDMNGGIIDYNRAYQEMLGYSDEELRHLIYTDITPEKWHAMEESLMTGQILQRGFSDPYEKEYRRKDGSVFPVELRTYLICDPGGNPLSMWAIVRDITERKQAEQTLLEWNQILERRVAERTDELNRSEVRFRQLAEATFEGIAVSEGGILLDGNPQFARIHGYELAAMIGRPMTDFVAPESRMLVAGRMHEGNEEAYECFGLRQDGSIFPAEARGSMRTWHGREIRVTALRDLTKVKQATAKLRAQQAELEHAQRLGLVSEVSAGIIHQIGQPLCAMGSNLAAALAHVGSCEVKHCGALPIIRDVDADVARMRDTVVHLRALANPGRTERVRFEFNAMVSNVLDLLRQEAGSRQIRISSDFSPDLPTVLGDSVQLSQVILNLVRNAFDSCAECPPERRSVGVETRLVNGGSIELSVRDSGTGIASEVIDGLFSPFVTTKPDGLGMGLRLSRTIVQSHGGTIDGHNNPDGFGATFRVMLPTNSGACYTKV